MADMKSLEKLLLFGIGMLLALFLLNASGCVRPPHIPGPMLVVTAEPDSGRPPFEMTITAICSKAGGTYTLIVEGEDPVESNEGAFVALVDDWPWQARVTWEDGSGAFSEAVVGISLENERPVAHDLWTVPGGYQNRSLIMIDLRYQEHGCTGSGLPALLSGIEDPDHTQDGYSTMNDSFIYHVAVEDMTTGQFESVFYGPDRKLLGNEFAAGPIFYWFVNWAGDYPLYPYDAWSPMECPPEPSEGMLEKQIHVSIGEDWFVKWTPMGCPPGPPPPDPPEGVLEKRIHVSVGEWGEFYRWIYTVFASSDSCSE